MILKKENIKSYIHSIVNTLDCSLPVPSEHLQYQKPNNYVIILQILGKLKWSISQSEIYDNLCGGRIKSSNETKLKLEASVTNAKNEQLVRAHASSIIYPKDIRMGFSIPSPAVIHPDMPFMAWVITLHSSQFQGLCTLISITDLHIANKSEVIPLLYCGGLLLYQVLLILLDVGTFHQAQSLKQ